MAVLFAGKLRGRCGYNIAISLIQLTKPVSHYVPEVFLAQQEQLQRQQNIEQLLFSGNELAICLAFRLKESSSLNVEK